MISIKKNIVAQILCVHCTDRMKKSSLFPSVLAIGSVECETYMV